MEEENHASSANVEMKVSEDMVNLKEGEAGKDISNSNVHSQKTEVSKDDYDDGEFIKVEKEAEDVKEISHLSKPIGVEETTNNGASLLLEAEEKIKSLELQLETLTEKLQHSESQNSLLKSEFDLTNEKLGKVSKQCQELDLNHNKLKEEISTAEEKHNIHLASHQEVKEALDAKHNDLENAKKKLEELEAELASSLSEAHKFKELHNERSSYAESESQRASELEKMLELAKSTAKDMEEQMSNLQEELKVLYGKISNLSEIEEKLKLSESQVAELESNFVSKDEVIQELTKELDSHKSSLEKMKEELVTLENLLSSSKDDIQSKNSSLEEAEVKLQQEMKTREEVEASLRNQELQFLSLQEEMKKLTSEKEDLTANLSLTKELCGELEEKFTAADQNFNKTDSLLSQALSYNAELEQKVKSLEELHGESRFVAETASQRSLELESLIQSSNANEEGLKEQIREKDVKLISVEQKNVELEEQVAIAQLKYTEAQSEIQGLGSKISELNVMLSNFEEEREFSKGQVQGYKDMITQLESSLNDADSKISELVNQLGEAESKNRDAKEESKQFISRVSEISQELEAFKARSESLEFVVQAANEKEKELTDKLNEITDEKKKFEELVNTSNEKFSQAENLIEVLQSDIKSAHEKVESYENDIKASNEKEKELTDKLNEVTEEKNKFEELANTSNEKLSQAENLIEALQSDIKSAQEKLESIENDIKASGIRESEILEKLKSAEEQLEHHGKAAEQATARCLDLESLHASSVKESELKLQEAVGNFTTKDSEVKQLQDRILFLEEAAAEATEKAASSKAELEANAAKMVDLEKTMEEFKMKLEQAFSENELLGGTNSELKSELEAHQSKVNELNDMLSSIHAEKEATAEQLASHVKTLEELTSEHSRGLELKSVTELRVKETELLLNEALEKFTLKDSEARGLSEKIMAIEAQLEKMTSVSDKRKIELEEALLKIQDLEKAFQEVQSKANQFETDNEGLAQANMTQTQQLAAYETKTNELEMALSAVNAEKEETLLELNSSKKTIEDLTQRLASEGEKLQSQIYSVVEENNALNKMCQNLKEEFQGVELRLEEQKAKEISFNMEVEKLIAEVDSMKLVAKEEKAVAASRLEEHSSILRETDLLNEQLMELQKNLSLAHKTIEEKNESESRMNLERDAVIKNLMGEMDAACQRAILLEKEIEELKQKSELAETQYEEKVSDKGKKIDLLNTELDDLKHKLHQNFELEKEIAELKNKLKDAKSSKQDEDTIIEESSKSEVTSRDMAFNRASPPDTIKKVRGGAHDATTEIAHVSPPSGLMALKFILGVALISVVIGIILGKKY